MSERPKSNLPFYGLVIRNIPILAVGFQRITTGKQLSDIMDDRLRSLISTPFKKVKIARPEESKATHQLEIGLMGRRYPILPKVKIKKVV